MPIYEYYCPRCNTLFSFFASTPGRRRSPSCPRGCDVRLEKRPSTFAMIRGGEAESDLEDDDYPFAGVDESRMEAAFESLAREMEGLENSEDPRVIGRAMRRFGELTGLELGPRMEEALAKIESGEDLESVEGALEQQLGADADDEDFSEFFRLKQALLRGRRRARVDPELYFFED